MMRQFSLWRLTLAALMGTGLTATLLMLVLPAMATKLALKQTLLLAFLAIVATYLCIAVGFALMGALSAKNFSIRPLGVRPETGPYRFATALGITGGLLVIPILLLSVVGAAAQSSAISETLHNIEPLAFTLITALYGLISGVLLGLLLLRPSLAWKVPLAAAAGSALGGVAVTLLLQVLPTHELIKSTAGVLALLAGILTLIHLGWSWSIRLILDRIAAQTAQHPTKPNATATQVWVTAAVGALLFISVSGTTRSLSEFVTAKPISTAPLTPPSPLNVPDCAAPQQPLQRAVWEVYMGEGRPDLSCGNRVETLLTMPGSQPDNPNYTAFDDVAKMVAEAKSEVLFTTMEYSGGDYSPGRSLTDALGKLYAKVKANPEAYPEGMTTTLTLGNYPVAEIFEWGAQVWTLLDDLDASGVPLNDPAVGWQVRLGNYKGTYPHSHVKIVVIDGTRLVTAGFNYTFVHYPENHVGEGGINLFDLALVTEGPAAQDGVATFRDLWQRSKEVKCDLSKGRPSRQTCELDGPDPLVRPKSAQRVTTFPENERVFSLYRREGETEANDAIMAQIAQAEQRIDLLHVNFSMNMTCIAAVLNPALCTARDQLPYMDALIAAMKRGVPVRLITDPTLQLGGIENRIAVGYLRKLMAREGIPSDLLQVRLFPGRLHAKATLTDDLLTVGSLNMHYSSWTQGPLGLNEAAAATNDPETIQGFREMYEDFWVKSEVLVLPKH